MHLQGTAALGGPIAELAAAEQVLISISLLPLLWSSVGCELVIVNGPGRCCDQGNGNFSVFCSTRKILLRLGLIILLCNRRPVKSYRFAALPAIMFIEIKTYSAAANFGDRPPRVHQPLVNRCSPPSSGRPHSTWRKLSDRQFTTRPPAAATASRRRLRRCLQTHGYGLRRLQ